LQYLPCSRIYVSPRFDAMTPMEILSKVANTNSNERNSTKEIILNLSSCPACGNTEKACQVLCKRQPKKKECIHPNVSSFHLVMGHNNDSLGCGLPKHACCKKVIGIALERAFSSTGNCCRRFQKHI